MKKVVLLILGCFLGYFLSSQELTFTHIPPVDEVSIHNFAINSKYMLISTATTPRKVLLYNKDEGDQWEMLPDSIEGFFKVNFLSDDKFILENRSTFLYDDGDIREISTGAEGQFNSHLSRLVSGDTLLYYLQDSKYYFSEDLGQSFRVVLEDTIPFTGGGNLIKYKDRFYHTKTYLSSSSVSVYSNNFDLISIIDIPRTSSNIANNSLIEYENDLYVFSNTSVTIINTEDLSKETFESEGLFNGVIYDDIIYYENNDGFYAIAIEDLKNQNAAYLLHQPSDPSDILRYIDKLYFIDRNVITVYNPMAQELEPLNLGLTFTSYIDMHLNDNELICVSSALNLYETNIGEEWKRITLDGKDKFIAASKSLTGDNLSLAFINNNTEEHLYLNQDSINTGEGNVFNLGIDSFLFAAPRCTDVNGAPRQVTFDGGTTWQDIDFRRCFPFYAQTQLVNRNLYLYDNTFTDQPSGPQATWRNYWAAWLDKENFSSGYIEPHSDIPYVNASVQITKDGLLHINPLDSVDNNKPSYLSYDFGESYTDLAASPNGELYVAPDGKSIVINNDLGYPRFYIREKIDGDYLEQIISPSNLDPVDRFLFLNDGRGLITTISGQILVADFTSSTSEISSNSDLFLYPNPSTGQVYFDNIRDYYNYKFNVFSSTGELVFSCEGCSSIDTVLQNGFYVVIAEDGDDRIVSKLIISK